MKLSELHAGLLTELIYPQYRHETDDGQGGVTYDWLGDPSDGVFAHIKYLTGTERWEADRVQAGNYIRAYIRFSARYSDLPYLTVKNRMMYRTTAFNVLAVQDVEFQREFLRIDMMQGRAT